MKYAFLVRSLFLTLLLSMGLQPLQSMAAVEESSWGEVKSWQQTLPAAKIAHHDTTSESWDPEFDEIVGEWGKVDALTKMER